MSVAYEAAKSVHFGAHPLGNSILGTVESITALTRRQIHGYYTRRYQPASMVVAVAGNVEHGEVMRLVRRAFRDGDEIRPPVRTRRAEPQRAPMHPVHVVNDDTEQANLLLGGYGLSRHDERRFALGVLSAALGGGSSSRLFQKVREERGLAYSVYSFTTAFAETGHFGVYAGCQPGKAEEVLGLMTAELDAVAEGRLDDDEIERGKGQMRGGLVLGLEDSGARMTRIGKSELVYDDILGLDQLLERIDAVTAADVAAVAEDVLHRPRCLTVVGPYGEHDFDGLV
jgi:predicted Zn-dependent peptidase